MLMNFLKRTIMKYINIATENSRVMTVLRSVFSINELKNLIPKSSQHNGIGDTNCVEILNKTKTVLCNSCTINKNQVSVKNYFKNISIYIYYQLGNEKSSELIRTSILGSEKDFFRTMIKYTSGDFKRLIYCLLNNSARNWLINCSVIRIHCDNYEFSKGNIFINFFMVKYEFHGEISRLNSSIIKFDMKKESIESIARKINEVFKTK